MLKKEDRGYVEFIQNPLNASMIKSAKEKIIALVKQDDAEWLEQENDLSLAEINLKMINMRYDILKATLQAMSNSSSGVNLELFNQIQEQYLEGIDL